MCARGLIASTILAGVDGVFLTTFPRSLELYTFNEFVREFGRTYQEHTAEWSKREELFNQRMEEVLAFRAGPPRSWMKGVTKFMDFTEAEYKAVLGYRGRKTARGPPRAESAIELHAQQRRSGSQLPSFIDVGSNLSLGALVRDQGSCGSCWAEAATSVLEGHMQRNASLLAAMTSAASAVQPIPTLSSQAVLSCTENPRRCGGAGGCAGATAELAFGMVRDRGLPLAVEWDYASGAGQAPQCRNDVFHNLRLGISHFEVLPSNREAPLKRALVESGGPIVVSADATDWSLYTGGIFSDTDGGDPGDFTLNHAVTLMGYREPSGNGRGGYWLIKNSWGTRWGEQGFIRLEMKANEEQHCGWDFSTHDGVACDGDPDTAWVCGTCGVLFDSSYPRGLYLIHPDDS